MQLYYRYLILILHLVVVTLFVGFSVKNFRIIFWFSVFLTHLTSGMA
jgi:hypothetical protein